LETSPIEAFLEGKEPQRCRRRASAKAATVLEKDSMEMLLHGHRRQGCYNGKKKA